MVITIQLILVTSSTYAFMGGLIYKQLLLSAVAYYKVVTLVAYYLNLDKITQKVVPILSVSELERGLAHSEPGTSV
jgi:hypothetical protein